MKKTLFVIILLLIPIPSHADLLGGDLPLLVEIVANTLQTLFEVERQTGLMSDAMSGIEDKINRIETIANVVQPSTWSQWKDPTEAMRRLKTIYYTLPKEYRSDKSDLIEDEISKAMNMVSELSPGANSSFLSGKEMEQRGADSSPGVAQKMTASGVGSLVAISAQTQIIESHITSLLAQSLAMANEREARSISSQGAMYSGVAGNLGSEDGRFSTQALSIGAQR